MAKKDLDRQFELEDGNGAFLVCWLKDDSRLKVGVRLTLKETGARLWRITHRSAYATPDAGINRNWKVGGLI